MKREVVPLVVSGIVDGRPVRWAPAERLVGDYDGRERTLQVFNADACDQRRLRDAIDERRVPIEEAAGGPLVIIFHSRKQSVERYADFVKNYWYPRVVDAPRELAPSLEEYVDSDEDAGPHRRRVA
jgi:hypothetical protein